MSIHPHLEVGVEEGGARVQLWDKKGFEKIHSDVGFRKKES
jgi:hypothetical protein